MGFYQVSERRWLNMGSLHGLEPEQLARIGIFYLEEEVLDVLHEAREEWGLKGHRLFFYGRLLSSYEAYLVWMRIDLAFRFE